MPVGEDTSFRCSTNMLLRCALLLNSRCTNLEAAALQTVGGKGFPPPKTFYWKEDAFFFLILLIWTIWEGWGYTACKASRSVLCPSQIIFKFQRKKILLRMQKEKEKNKQTHLFMQQGWNSLIVSLIIGLAPPLGWLRLNQSYYTYCETELLC